MIDGERKEDGGERKEDRNSKKVDHGGILKAVQEEKPRKGEDVIVKKLDYSFHSDSGE